MKPLFQNSSEINPQIYVYRLPHSSEHNGYIKIGYTGGDVKKRIYEQTHTASVTPEILMTASAVRNNGTTFTDKDIHRILERRHYHCKDSGEDRNEWYNCGINEVKSAILELKTGRKSNGRHADFKPRPEQQRAIDKTVAYFESAEKENLPTKPKFLWNAKMRFGKTFASYELAKKMGMKRILVLTFKPAVESAWQEDLESHVDFEGWQFISNKAADGMFGIEAQYTRARKADPIVVFGSFQDLLGTNDAGGIKAKNEFIHSEDWDLVIFDEYHYGCWRENAKKLFVTDNEEADADFDQEEYAEKEAGNAYNESFLPISTKYYLFLSGTPFRALNSGEFIEEQIFNWTYSDEQRAKEQWDDANGANPYASLPHMVMMTYKMPDEITKIAQAGEFDGFDLNVFFSTTGKGETAEFKFKNEVQSWLDLIRGAYMPKANEDLKLGKQKAVLPFDNTRLLRHLSHTFWFLPNVAACDAMENLLAEPQNTFYHDYKIINCSGTKAGIGVEALKPVEAKMDDPFHTKTITLSCGKLTTGVTVRPWTGVFMLRNLKSPETYFQTAFRVQSPWTTKNDLGETEIVKDVCYVFDFALDRALRQISDYSCKLNVNESNPEKKVEDFINHLPVLAYDGSVMKQISAGEILDMAMAGTSATLLARRWESALLVNVDNDTLNRLINNPRAMEALMNIEGFRALNKDIETIIAKSEKVKKLKEEATEKPTKEVKEEISKEEKEYKSLRKQVQEKLIKFATRIPIFMYLTDYREYSLKDVIKQLEPALFHKVTGLEVLDFELLCSLGVFNSEMMNDAVYKFKRYEDASLSYTGINRHSGDDYVGGFDEKIERDEFNAIPVVVKPEPVFDVIEEVEKIEEENDSAEDMGRLDIVKGAIVYNDKFGKGRVLTIADDKIWVSFVNGYKTFHFPEDIENGFLRLEDK